MSTSQAGLSVSEALQGFTLYLQAKGRTPATVKSYLGDRLHRLARPPGPLR